MEPPFQWGFAALRLAASGVPRVRRHFAAIAREAVPRSPVPDDTAELVAFLAFAAARRDHQATLVADGGPFLN